MKKSLSIAICIAACLYVNSCANINGLNPIATQPEKHLQAKTVKGFAESYVKPGLNLYPYQCIYIEPVDTSNAKLITSGVFDEKATMEELSALSKEMKKRFANILGTVLPVKEGEEKPESRRTLEIRLKLMEVAGTDVITNIVSGIYLHTGITGAIMGMKGSVVDQTTKEELVVISDKHEGAVPDIDPVELVLGLKAKNRWAYAYDTMDLWADSLAKFISEGLGKPYKSPLKKIVP